MFFLDDYLLEPHIDALSSPLEARYGVVNTMRGQWQPLLNNEPRERRSVRSEDIL